MSEVYAYTISQLKERTEEIMEKINESGKTAVITHHGRIIALIEPFDNADDKS